MNDIQFALYEVKLALNNEIEELMTYAGLVGPGIERDDINSRISGMRTAQEYLHRKMQCYDVP